MIELGIPFSDPSADGPVIQQAAAEAVKTFSMNDLVRELQNLSQDFFTPDITLMTYMNPVYHYGIARLITKLRNTAVKGLLMPDFPVEEYSFIKDQLKANDSIRPVWIASNNLSADHLYRISSIADYYIYLVAYLGTTGKSISEHDHLTEVIKIIKDSKDLPVVVGFGIKSKKDVETVLNYADGAVVGTALIEKLSQGINQAKNLIKSLL